ncbi:zinc-binding dehydrogenase [Deinococcus sp.]|uniref:zinc-binding dehydrogenase n=1 Tax=Deinococcus sp. TaxID=47478 RepID=UPI003C79BCFA
MHRREVQVGGTYSGSAQDFMPTPLDELARQVAAGTLKLPLGPTFRLHQIVEAHRVMEANSAGGKMVVLT